MTIKIFAEHGTIAPITHPNCLLQYYNLETDPSLQTASLSRLLQQASVDCDGIIWHGDVTIVQIFGEKYYENNPYCAALWCKDSITDEIFRFTNGVHPQITEVLTQVCAQMEVQA